MESDLCYVDQCFEEIFEDELLFFEELDRHTFPIGFFDQNFEDICNDKLKFLANVDVFSIDNANNDSKEKVDAKGVGPLSDWLIRRKRKKNRTRGV